jgi:hypothetical protein
MKLFNKPISVIFIIFTVMFVFSPLTSVEAGLLDAFGNNSPLNQTADNAGYDPGQTSVNPIIQTVIQVALSFLGVIFLILMIYGGFLWMTASGNEEKVSKARKILTAAIIGLIIVIGAYAITELVMSKLGGEVLN